MSDLIITSLQNPLVKQMRKLSRGKEGREQGLFLLEGTHLIETAGEVGYPLAVICATEIWIEKHEDLWERAIGMAQRAVVVSADVLSAIATTVSPDGVVASAERQVRPGLDPKLQLAIVLERIQDPGNLGTIIRTATATEVGGLWLSADSVDLHNPKVLRGSAGAWFRLPMQVSDSLGETVNSCRQGGMQIMATTSTAELSYWQVDFTRPTLILLGNEGAGLSEELLNLADVQVQIPLAGGVESLNVAIATALFLYEARRQTTQS